MTVRQHRVCEPLWIPRSIEGPRLLFEKHRRRLAPSPPPCRHGTQPDPRLPTPPRVDPDLVVEADRARAAESDVREKVKTIQQQLDTIQRKEQERLAATATAEQAKEKAQAGEKELAMTYGQLEAAYADAKQAKDRAEQAKDTAEKAAKKADQAAAAERAAKEETKRLLSAERARVKELEEEKRKLSTKLK